MMEHLLHFTFHNVSINTSARVSEVPDQKTLHSTMFLLIPVYSIGVASFFCSLHSTMFLLIRTLKDSVYANMKLYIPQCWSYVKI